jgi:hypothetical protein
MKFWLRGHKLTDSNVFIDGTTQKPNDLGVIEDVPTYAVIRSTNADGSPINVEVARRSHG